jgi:hypothetical protein
MAEISNHSSSSHDDHSVNPLAQQQQQGLHPPQHPPLDPPLNYQAHEQLLPLCLSEHRVAEEEKQRHTGSKRARITPSALRRFMTHQLYDRRLLGAAIAPLVGPMEIPVILFHGICNAHNEAYEQVTAKGIWRNHGAPFTLLKGSIISGRFIDSRCWREFAGVSVISTTRSALEEEEEREDDGLETICFMTLQLDTSYEQIFPFYDVLYFKILQGRDPYWRRRYLELQYDINFVTAEQAAEFCLFEEVHNYEHLAEHAWYDMKGGRYL